jgi:muconolactone delta-isomerase
MDGKSIHKVVRLQKKDREWVPVSCFEYSTKEEADRVATTWKQGMNKKWLDYAKSIKTDKCKVTCTTGTRVVLDREQFRNLFVAKKIDSSKDVMVDHYDGSWVTLMSASEAYARLSLADSPDALALANTLADHETDKFIVEKIVPVARETRTLDDAQEEFDKRIIGDLNDGCDDDDESDGDASISDSG